MIPNTSATPHSSRLNPFAFPSDTDLRFVLLIVAVLGTSLFIYNWICLQTHFQAFLASSICAQHQAPIALQTLSDKNFQAFYKVGDTTRQCGTAYGRISAIYMLSGVVLVEAVALVIYWLSPFWNLWRGKLIPLEAEDSPELMVYLTELCREAQIAQSPSFVSNPFNKTVTGLAFGRIGRYYVALPGGLVALFTMDQVQFRAIVLHELAHLRNADINKTYFAIASGLAFVIVALIPFIVISIVNLANNSDIFFVINEAARVLVMTVLVLLILTATLRAREFYADVRASIWENSAQPLLQVLTTQKRSKNRWLRIIRVHPDPLERSQVLNETDRLFRMGLWEAFGFGIVIGIAAPNVLSFMNLLFYFQLQMAPSDALDWQMFGSALILAPIIAVAVGLSIWRTAFSALVRGQTPLGIGRAGLYIGVGLILGTFLSLSFNNDSFTNPLFLFVLCLPWGLIVITSLFLFLRWIAIGTSSWINVIISSRSPRLFYSIGLLAASIVLVAILSQIFLFYTLTATIASFTKTPFELLINFVASIIINILLLIDPLLSPSVLIAFIGLWAFPLASWFWRKRVITPAESNWVFLDASSQPIVLPHQNSFRLRFALIAGLISGLVFCGLLLLIRFGVHVGLSETIRDNHQFKVILSTIQIVLAVLIQETTVGIVASRIRRLSTSHALFSAFVGGCIMTIGIVLIDLLFGGSITVAFIWSTFCLVLNGGALLALPIVLIVSVTAHRIGHPMQ